LLSRRHRRAVALAKYRMDVDARLRSGESFEEVEDWINGLPLPDVAKSALWLWLWANQPEDNQRQVALDGLHAVGMPRD
jgi:hypothetical protein